MDYNTFTQSTRNLDFIHDDSTADAAVKAVFGVMTSKMGEEQAKEFISFFPGPWPYDKLRSHQERPTEIDPNEYMEVIASQFDLNRQQAEELVRNLLHTTKENLPEEKVASWESMLPEDWSIMVEKS